MKGYEKIISKNIQKILDEYDLNQNELAKIAGVSESTVGKWVLMKSSPRMGTIQKMADHFNLPKSYILEEEEKPLSFNMFEYNYYPVGVAAGLPENISSTNAEKISIPDSIMGKWAGQDDIMVMRINGQSMNKTMPDQSLIAVKPTRLENLNDGDIVVYSDDHEYSVKRMYKQDGHIIFRPHSTDIRFTDYIVSTKNENLVIYGKVVVYIVEMD